MQTTTDGAGVVQADANVGASAIRRWIVVLVLLGIVVTGFFDRISIAVLFTNTEFQNAMATGFNPTLFGLLMTGFLVPYGLSSIVLSFTGDRFGPRRMLTCATAVWGVLMLLMGAAGSYTSMLLYRGLLGIMEGPQFAWILKVINRWFPCSEHGRANSIWLVGSPLGSAIGFPLAIWLVAVFGWRGAFFSSARSVF